MTWLTENWFWILTFIAFIAMHMFGHDGLVFVPIYNFLARRWVAPGVRT